MGLVALQHVGSSRTRAQTRVHCTGRRILNHCATREAQRPSLLTLQCLHILGTLLLKHLCYQTKCGFALWVCTKANLLIPGCSEGKCRVYCKVPDEESRATHAQKAQTAQGVLGKHFKCKVREGSLRYVITLCTILDRLMVT